MNEAIEKAKYFLEHERAFRLGELLTEQFHPQTNRLSQTADRDVSAAIRMLQSVDEDIPPAAQRVFQQPEYQLLIGGFTCALEAGRKIFFTGCGSTGRLSILLEAAWRRFWRKLKVDQPEIFHQFAALEDCVCSVMAGGDFALIKSVEGFEDFPEFGRFQLQQSRVQPGDVVVAITEGGETPFVIGTAWQGLDAQAKVFFVYNNPSDVLSRHVQRSREVIEEPRIHKLELATGPMAITGSTRMQATTIELLIVAAALESALVKFLRGHLTQEQWEKLAITIPSTDDYYRRFVNLLRRLAQLDAVNALTAMVQFEEEIYRRRGLVTYLADFCMLDVLTDTTERSPTFMLPPFRKINDNLSPRSWAFVKNPFLATKDAWHNMLQRSPRGLDWPAQVYRQLNAPQRLRENPPLLDNNQIYQFQIGCEPDPSRTDAAESALVIIATADEFDKLAAEGQKKYGQTFSQIAALRIGSASDDRLNEKEFNVICDLPDSPLCLWRHLALKLILNTISTATMVRMGRVMGNAMIWLSPSNKKLIDRGSRLISHLTGAGYEQACVALHQAMEEVDRRRRKAEEVPSPVALAIDQLEKKGKK